MILTFLKNSGTGPDPKGSLTMPMTNLFISTHTHIPILIYIVIFII